MGTWERTDPKPTKGTAAVYGRLGISSTRGACRTTGAVPWVAFSQAMPTMEAIEVIKTTASMAAEAIIDNPVSEPCLTLRSWKSTSWDIYMRFRLHTVSENAARMLHHLFCRAFDYVLRLCRSATKLEKPVVGLGEHRRTSPVLCYHLLRNCCCKHRHYRCLDLLSLKL
jgi:hypothetical protein